MNGNLGGVFEQLPLRFRSHCVYVVWSARWGHGADVELGNESRCGVEAAVATMKIGPRGIARDLHRPALGQR